MDKVSDYKRILRINKFVVIIFSVLIGMLPLLLYKVRQLVVDSCLGEYISVNVGVAELIAVFLATALIEQFLRCLLVRYIEAKTIKQSTKLDYLVREKIPKIKYQEIENVNFTSLYSQTENISDSISTIYNSISFITSAIVQLLSCLFVSITISVWISLLVLFIFAVDVVLNIICAKKTKGFWATYIFTMRKANAFSRMLTGRDYAAEKKIFGTYDFLQNKFNNEFDNAKSSNIKLGKRRLRVEIITKLTSCLFPVVILLAMLPALLSKYVSVGTYSSIFFFLSATISSIDVACAGMFEVQKSKNCFDAIDALVALPEDRCDTRLLVKVPSKLEFRNVSFSYPDAKQPFLNNISFTLDLRGKYAVVGENGCGKSTLVKLLLGLYQPDSGEILIDDVPLTNLGRNEINAVFSAVFQNSFHYPLTLQENLFMGNCENADKTFEDIAQKAELVDIINKLPNGIQTDLAILKQNSANLSGGEWQKIAVARCLFSSSAMVIMDEPNASLDPLTEARLYNVCSEILQNRGYLLVSHRLGAIKNAQQIIVLKDGSIEAIASHEELMKHCEYYRKMYDTQRSFYHEE